MGKSFVLMTASFIIQISVSLPYFQDQRLLLFYFQTAASIIFSSNYFKLCSIIGNHYPLKVSEFALSKLDISDKTQSIFFMFYFL